MRRVTLLGSIALLLLPLASSPALADASGQQRAEAAGRGLVGTAAPRLVLKTIDGQDIDLGSLYGKKAIYLKFWATWCVPCREQMPHFEHAYETAGPDLAVIAINAGFDDSVEEIQKFRHAMGITMPIVMDDGRLGAAFKLRVTPQHIVIGRDGRIQYVGHLADARLDAALLAARQGGLATGGNSTGGRVVADLPAVRVGDPLPAQSVTTLDGSSFALQSRRGKTPTVLVFLSPWCESYLESTRPVISANCRRAREQVNDLVREHKVRWIGIASGLWATPEDLRQYRADYKVSIPLTLDESGTLFRAFRVTEVPTVLVADAQGKVIRRIAPDETDGLRRALEAQ